MTGPVRVRKRPIEGNAWRYDGTNADEIVAWITVHGGTARYVEGELVVLTYDGHHDVPEGHYILSEPDGEAETEGVFFYPVRPSVYAKVYEELGP